MIPTWEIYAAIIGIIAAAVVYGLTALVIAYGLRQHREDRRLIREVGKWLNRERVP